MGEDVRAKIGAYSDAPGAFRHAPAITTTSRDVVQQSLEGLPTALMADTPMAKLSDGQKRCVELIIVEHADADPSADETKADQPPWIMSLQNSVLKTGSRNL